MPKEKSKQLKVSVEEQTIKVELETVLYFKINLKEKTVALSNPSDSYLSPLSKNIELDKHKAFVATYKAGLDYAEKMLKNI